MCVTLSQNFTDKTIKAEWVEHLVLKLGTGDFFGEIALLSHKARQATVKAAKKVIALRSYTRGCPAFSTHHGWLTGVLHVIPD